MVLLDSSWMFHRTSVVQKLSMSSIDEKNKRQLIDPRKDSREELGGRPHHIGNRLPGRLSQNLSSRICRPEFVAQDL